MITTHLLALLIGLLYPLFFLLTYKRTNERIKKNARFKLIDYKQTIVIFWTLSMLILVHYLIDNSLADNFYPNFNAIGIIIALLILIYIVLQFISSKVTTKEKAESIMKKMKGIFYYLPKTKLERNWFMGLSLSAGICEEIIFRLFLFSYLLENTNLVLAFVLANLIFALTHISTGKQNMIGAFILGLIFTAIFYFSANIWLAIILHGAIDISVGILSYRAYNMTNNKLP